MVDGSHRGWLAAVCVLLLACGAADRRTAVDPLAAGMALYQGGDIDGARAAWQALLDSGTLNGTPEEARLHTWLGLAAYQTGDYAESRRHGERGLELALRLGAPAAVADAQNALGLLTWTEGRLADAAALFRSALDSFARLEDRAGMAKASNNLALVQSEQGSYDDARDALRTALQLARVEANARHEGRILANLGLLEIWTGEPARALALLDSARARASAAEDPKGVEAALGQTGVAYLVMGRPGAALAALDSALAVARANGMRAEEANDLLVIAGIYADAGDVEQALRVYDEARRINEELGLPIETGIVLREEAALRAGRGLLDLAHRDAQRALALHSDAGARDEEFSDLLVIADVARRQGDLAAAREALARASTLADALQSAPIRLALSVQRARLAEAEGDAVAMLRTLDGAVTDMPYAGPGITAEVHALRMRAWQAREQLDSAVAAGYRAVAAIETVRDGFASGPLRSSYVADRSTIYADLVLALLARGDTERAFAVADAARGRALVEHLSAARAGAVRDGAVPQVGEAERLLRRIDLLLTQLALHEGLPPLERGPEHAETNSELLRHLEHARREYGALLVQAAEADPKRASLLSVRPPSTVEVRESLAEDEALLEFLPTRDRLFIFVVTRDGVRVVQHDVSHEQLANRVRLARELQEQVPANGRDRAVTGALHRLLIEDVVSEHDAGIRHVFLVPHGALTYLPFASLVDASGRVLAERFTLSHLPSAGVLPVLRQSRERELGTATAFAPFPERLLATRREAEAFRRSVPGSRATTGRRATESAVRKALEQSSIVHVASHAAMDARNPLFSWIELVRGAGTPQDDGRLEVHELLDMQVGASLVFLSGCQTALGGAWATAFDQGEDFATLSQGFLLAGARNIVATLWRIDDAGAAAFAARFYQHLRTLPPAGALASAQRDLRDDPRWSSPYYWAGYTITGDGGGLAPQNAGTASVR